MNEEWFGICSKGPTNMKEDFYQLYPRAAYYALQEVHKLNPYANGVTYGNFSTNNFFSKIGLTDAVMKARGDKAALIGEQIKKVRMSELRADLYVLSTQEVSGYQLPKIQLPAVQNYPEQLGFDHMQSFYIGVEAKPSESFRANVSFNILGNVAKNPINEIFCGIRGRPQTVPSFKYRQRRNRTSTTQNRC